MRKTLALLAFAAALVTQVWGQVPRLSHLGFCNIATLSSAVGITSANCVFASFTAALGTNGILTVTAVASGVIIPGQPLVGSGVPANSLIQGYVPNSGPGIGGVGQYRVTIPPTTAVSSTSLTTGGVPPQSNYAVICAYTQNVNYMVDGTPTATVGSGGQQITAGQCLPSTAASSKIKFFQQTATATLGLDFYNWQ